MLKHLLHPSRMTVGALGSLAALLVEPAAAFAPQV